MEHSHPRMRHDGNGDRTSGTTPLPASPLPDSGAVTPGQLAKQRLQRAAAAGSPRSAPALQEAFVDERNDVLAVINELEDQLDRDQERREKLERELAAGAEKLQAASGRVQELEWQAVTLNTRIESLETARQQAAALEEELRDAHAAAERVKETLVAAERERDDLKSELKHAQKQLDELWGVRRERDGLRGDCTSLSGKVDALERQQRDLAEERAALQAEVQQTRAALEQAAEERNQFQTNARAAEERGRELTQVQDLLSEKVEGLRTERKSLQAQIAHLERENARLVEQRRFYESEVASLRNQVRTAETALGSVKKAFTEVRTALSDTSARARRRNGSTPPPTGTASSAGATEALPVEATEMSRGVIKTAVADAADIVPAGDPRAVASTPVQVPEPA